MSDILIFILSHEIRIISPHLDVSFVTLWLNSYLKNTEKTFMNFTWKWSNEDSEFDKDGFLIKYVIQRLNIVERWFQDKTYYIFIDFFLLKCKRIAWNRTHWL